MEKETLILQELFIPVLQKNERFEESKCDSFFWNKVTTEFVNFEQDKKPFYASIYSLNLVNVEQVLNKLESLLNPFLDQIAETYVQGYSSNITQKLSKVSHYYNERVLFYKNLKKAIFLSERKRIKSELPYMYEKYTFEIDEKQLVEAITKIERQALRDKMKVWDEELLVQNDEEQEITFHTQRQETKTISLVTYLKYAVAACFVLGLGFWFYNSQNQIVVPDNPVVTQPKEQDSSLELPKPVLVDATSSSKVTDVLINEGMGFSNSNNKIKLVSINNSERIVSIQNAIDAYQKFIENELLKSPADGLKNKNLLIEVEKEINRLLRELTELQTKQSTYLFDGKTLTIYDISPNTITILAFAEIYYIKKKKSFYTLTVANSQQKYSKVSDSTLKETLDKILYKNGKFE
jgi:sulfur relay (sulfurtransferase) DsrF/TusC family protein